MNGLWDKDGKKLPVPSIIDFIKFQKHGGPVNTGCMTSPGKIISASDVPASEQRPLDRQPMSKICILSGGKVGIAQTYEGSRHAWTTGGELALTPAIENSLAVVCIVPEDDNYTRLPAPIDRALS